MAQIVNGGKQVFEVPAQGYYVINVVAQVNSGQHYGLYGYTLAQAPPAPTVTLSPDPATVDVGGTTMLTWTSTDAASCTALDGWSGTLAPSGTQATSALSVTRKFSITCTGDGGTGSAAAQVNVAQPVSGGGSGGGGALGSATVLALGLATAWITRRRRRSRPD